MRENSASTSAPQHGVGAGHDDLRCVSRRTILGGEASAQLQMRRVNREAGQIDQSQSDREEDEIGIEVARGALEAPSQRRQQARVRDRRSRHRAHPAKTGWLRVKRICSFRMSNTRFLPIAFRGEEVGGPGAAATRRVSERAECNGGTRRRFDLSS